MKHTYYSLLALFGLFLILFSSCGKSTDFTVKGVISGADNQIVYFENVGLSTVTVLDSAKLSASGKFSFSLKRPQYPEFYRLRLHNDQRINLAVDSTETITILADANTFATSYTVEGSESCKAIKEITLAQLDANQMVNKAHKEYQEKLLADSTYQQIISQAIQAYKIEALKYIYGAPMSTAAYFALFQQIDGMQFFDIYDKSDSRAFGAVATSFDFRHPEAPRSKHLRNLALMSQKVTREQTINLDNIKAEEVSYIDIVLPDIYDNNVSLSSVAKDKTVIINFTAFQSEWSPFQNMILGELFEAYHEKGLEIYQISLDTDLHLWKNGALNLPWMCVRDPQTVFSQTAGLYNVKQLPASFILDKKGNLVKRVDNPEELEAELKRVI